MANQLTPAQIAAFMKTLGLTTAPPPTEAVGAVGSKPFVGDSQATNARRSNTSAYTAGINKRVPVQNMNDLSSPAWWAKNIVAGGKSAVVDPVVKASKMDWLNPDSGLGPVDRLNTLLGDALTVGSLVAPVKGAATTLADRAIANAWAKSVPNMTKPVGPTAADWFYAKYGLHGSPNQGIKQLEPRFGSKAFPNDAVTFAQPLDAAKYDLVHGVENVSTYAPQGADSSIYVAKYPRGYQTKQYNNYIISDVPGKVVGEYKIPSGKYGTASYDLRNELISKSAPEYLLSILLNDAKSPALRKKLVENFGQVAKNLVEAQTLSKSEMIARSVGRRA